MLHPVTLVRKRQDRLHGRPPLGRELLIPAGALVLLAHFLVAHFLVATVATRRL